MTLQLAILGTFLLGMFVSVCRCKADEAEQPGGIRYNQIGTLVSYLFASGYRRKLILQNNQMEITDGRFQVGIELTMIFAVAVGKLHVQNHHWNR